MIKIDNRKDAETLVSKILCSCFLSIGGTVTVRAERARDAAKAIAGRLQSNGYLKDSEDSTEVENVISGAIYNRGEMPASFSIPARWLAGRIFELLEAAEKESKMGPAWLRQAA